MAACSSVSVLVYILHGSTAAFVPFPEGIKKAWVSDCFTHTHTAIDRSNTAGRPKLVVHFVSRHVVVVNDSQSTPFGASQTAA